MSLFEDVSTLFAAAITDGQDNEAIVKAAYEDLLGYADADTMNNSAARIDYWVQKLSSGELTTDNFGGSFLEEANTNQGSLISSTTFENNQTVVAAHEDAYEANPDVTLEDLTAVAAENRVEDVAEEDEGVTGETFTLTTSADVGADFTGGTGDDTFVANDETFGSNDVLDGGDGDDRLLYTDESDAGGTLDVAEMSSIEEIYIKAIGGTGEVSGTQEQQVVTLTGNPTADSTFLNMTSNFDSDTTLAEVAEAIADATLSNEAKAYGIEAIAHEGNSLVIDYAASEGDVGDLAAQAASGGVSFSAGTEVTKGVETITAENGDITVDAANYSGVEEIWSDRSTQNLDVEKLEDEQAVGIKGNGNVSNGDLTAFYKDAATSGALAVTGGATAGDFSLAAGSGTATNDGLEDFAITSLGDDDNTVGTVDLSSEATVKTVTITANSDLTTGNLTLADTETLNIAGAAAVTAATASAGLDSVVTIDASENSGGVDFDLDANSKDVTVTGGDGDDRIDFDDSLTEDDTVDLAGGTDTIAVDAAVTKKDFDGVTNVERVEFTANGVTQDLSVLADDGITTFVYTNGGSANLAPTEDEDNFQHIITADTTDFIPEVATITTSNVMNVELVDSDISGTDGELGNASAGDSTTYETINLTSSKASDGTFDGANVIDKVDMAAGGDLNISGDAKVTVSASVNGINVEASALSASLDFTGSSSGADTVVGSSEADTVDLQDGANTITTNGGGDSLVYGKDGGLTVTDFTAGAGTDADTLVGDLSEIIADSAASGDVVLLQGTSNNVSDGDTGSIVTADGVTDITGSTGNILAVAGEYDTAAAAGRTLEEGGANVVEHNIDDGDAFMMLFTDGTDSFLAAVDNAETTDDSAFQAGDLGEEVLVTLNGISDLDSLADGNFSFQS